MPQKQHKQPKLTIDTLLERVNAVVLFLGILGFLAALVLGLEALVALLNSV